MKSIINSKVGNHRGNKRVWLEGVKLSNAGLNAGDSIEVSYDSNAKVIMIKKDETGSNIVSKRTKNGILTPIIDLCNKSITALYDAVETVRIVIKSGVIRISPHHFQEKTAERENRLLRKLKAGIPLSTLSICHGGGVLDAGLHEGLDQGYVKSKVAVAIEIEHAYLESSLRNNNFWAEDSIAINSAVEEVRLPDNFKVDVLTVGLPCTGASLSGRSKLGLSCAEQHETAGAVFHYFLKLCEAVSPSIVVIENVTQYESTASYFVINSVLRTLGYNLHTRVVSGAEFGALEDRSRLIVVAVSRNLAFETEWLDQLKSDAVKPDSIKDILESVPEDSDMWKSYDYLAQKELRDIEQKKGFRRQLLTPDADKVGTIGRGYAKGRSTEPFLVHPTNKSLSRLFTPREHARLKTIPESLINGLSATIAHQVLGQSVCYNWFVELGRALSQNLRKIAGLSFGQFDQSAA